MKTTAVVDWELAQWQAFTGKTSLYRDEKLQSISKAGEGNMNLTLRLQFEGISVIAKHAPPYCFKFPMIPAPAERLSMELEFFRLASRDASLQERLPRIYHFDPEKNIALLEDLGVCLDYSSLYTGVLPEQEADLTALVRILSNLHHLRVDDASFSNQKMRDLNHQYIFILPYSDKRFDLTPHFGSRTEEAQSFRDDERLREACGRLGEIYLSQGVTLVHGDFYPLSWLKTESGVSVIDPEFGFKGQAEFDVGVFTAHLLMSQLEEDKISRLIEQYVRPEGFDLTLAYAFAGSEISRRLLHVAQLPLKLSPQEKIALLVRSRDFIRQWS